MRRLINAIVVTGFLFCACAQATADGEATAIVIDLLLGEQGVVRKTVVLQWQRPQQREDESPLASDEIKSYQIRYRRLDEPDQSLFKVLDDGELTTTIRLTAVSNSLFGFSIRTIDNDGQASAFTEELVVDLGLSQ